VSGEGRKAREEGGKGEGAPGGGCSSCTTSGSEGGPFVARASAAAAAAMRSLSLSISSSMSRGGLTLQWGMPPVNIAEQNMVEQEE